MTKTDPEDIQSHIEQKAARRQKKKKPGMKESGRSVKELQRLIIKGSSVRKKRG